MLTQHGAFLRDVLHNLYRAFIDKIAHLLRELVPCSDPIVAENHADNCEQNEDDRCEGKDRCTSAQVRTWPSQCIYLGATATASISSR
jgi:hypothetical protein